MQSVLNVNHGYVLSWRVGSCHGWSVGAWQAMLKGYRIWYLMPFNVTRYCEKWSVGIHK